MAAPRLVVDVQTAQGGFFGNRGIRRYALGLVHALRDQGALAAALVNPGRPWAEPAPPDLADAADVRWATTSTLRELDAAGATAYLITSPFERTRPVQSAIPPYVVESGLPIVSVLYDLIPEHVDVYPPDLMAMYWARRPLLAQADLLLTLSEHVRRDVIERVGVDPDRVAVIGAGASEFFGPARPGDGGKALLAEAVPEIERPYVLSVTGWSAHKNAEGLIAAWSQVPDDVRRSHQLVLTCTLPPDAKSVWREQGRDSGIRPDELVVTDFVDDEVLRALYQNAALFVLPSRQEGFGLPVVEAARCGCPAITSDAASLPEVLAWPPSTFPVDDVAAAAALIERGLRDNTFRSDLRAAGVRAAERHTWDHVAERTVQACAGMPVPRRSRRTPPVRVAVIGRASALTFDATASLADVLGDDCHLDRFASGTGTVEARRAGTGWYPARALGHAFDPWGYDALVYVVDGFPPRELIDLTTRYPGIVWFVEQSVDPELMVELARRARGAVATAEVGGLPAGGAAFGRPVPTSVVSATEVAGEVRALLGRFSRLAS
jgi:glycosyltransferase involved in cell wall biosynthesis